MKLKNLLLLGTLCALIASCSDPTPPVLDDMGMSMWDGDSSGCLNGQFR